jgi:hypothetical protein
VVETITVRNLINDQPYTVRVGLPDSPFQPGHVVFGSLIPWRGEWYWSGAQQILESPTAEDIADACNKLLASASAIAYRYCPERAAKAREFARLHHTRFLAHYENDLDQLELSMAFRISEPKRIWHICFTAQKATFTGIGIRRLRWPATYQKGSSTGKTVPHRPNRH